MISPHFMDAEPCGYQNPGDCYEIHKKKSIIVYRNLITVGLQILQTVSLFSSIKPSTSNQCFLEQSKTIIVCYVPGQIPDERLLRDIVCGYRLCLSIDSWRISFGYR